MFSHSKTANGRVVEIKLSGRISGHEYGEVCALLEDAILKHKAVSLLCELDQSFRGITLPVMWRTALTAAEGLIKLRRVAVVGERKGYKWARVMVRAFHGDTRYFERAHCTRALHWLEHASVSADLPAKEKFAGDAGYRNQRSASAKSRTQRRNGSDQNGAGTRSRR